MNDYPVTDLDLARRLERTEAVANAAFVEARARQDPDVGADFVVVAGVHAMFDGVQSPITQTFGLGIFDPIGDDQLSEIEAFFAARGAPVFHEVCPMISADTIALLNRRGYKPVEFSSVLIRPTSVAEQSGAAASPIEVHRVTESESESDIDLWSRVAAEGWSSESAELATVVEEFGRVIGNARGAHCFIAYSGERPIAAAGLVLNTDVALLAGASTIPSARRQGAQQAQLRARLQFAADHGCGLAMMVALPGSGSHRNAERHGFRVAYTRTKWQLLPMQ